jgi:hypothetical protein
MHAQLSHYPVLNRSSENARALLFVLLLNTNNYYCRSETPEFSSLDIVSYFFNIYFTDLVTVIKQILI